MGCCQPNIEIGELALISPDQTTAQKTRAVKTEEDFSDLSLDSDHRNSIHVLETTNTCIADSFTNVSRGKSVSLHKANLESAFCISQGLLLTRREEAEKQLITN